MLFCIHGRRRPAQFLRSAAWHRSPALHRPRDPCALERHDARCACSASAMRRPYLGLFREEAERCLALMPAPQGVVRWPSSKPALAALGRRGRLAADRRRGRSRAAGARAGKFHRPRRAVARSVARVGRRRAIARRGAEPARACGRAWTRRRSATAGPIRARRSPICCARPGSRRPAGARRFTCRRSRAAGSCARRWPGNGPARRYRRPFAGVHIVEATKQVYRAIPARRERRRLVPALQPVLAPSPGAAALSRFDDGEAESFAYLLRPRLGGERRRRRHRQVR